MSPSAIPWIPTTQTAAVVTKLGGKVEFRDDYPVPTLSQNEVLARVLYTGVCQSDLHTARGTAASVSGDPITNIKFPQVGGHEGVGRIIALGPGIDHKSPDIYIGMLVDIRFASRICRRYDFCLAGKEQHCTKATNHLHHEDGSFQEYIALDADYLTILPQDVDPVVVGPVLCAGVTAYKAVLNAKLKAGDWLVVVGAGGGLGHLAVQYGTASGAQIIAVDGGNEKRDFMASLGVQEFVDFSTTSDLVQEIHAITGGGAHAVIVAVGNPKGFAQAADMLRVGGTLSCIGIPSGRAYLEASISTIVIKGLHITGNLVGSLKECLEAVELVRRGIVRPKILVRPFRDLQTVYDELDRGEVAGRIVLRIGSE